MVKRKLIQNITVHTEKANIKPFNVHRFNHSSLIVQLSYFFIAVILPLKFVQTSLFPNFNSVATVNVAHAMTQ